MVTLFCRLISENQENGRKVCNIVAWASLCITKYIFKIYIYRCNNHRKAHINSYINFTFEKYFITELIINGVERENALLKIRV